MLYHFSISPSFAQRIPLLSAVQVQLPRCLQGALPLATAPSPRLAGHDHHGRHGDATGAQRGRNNATVPRESPKARAKMGQDGPSSNVVLLFWWSLGRQLPVKTTKNRLK